VGLRDWWQAHFDLNHKKSKSRDRNMTIHTDPNAAHAVYAPSSAHRWTVCTASAEAIAKLPEQESGEAAIAGTEAHEELEKVLKGAMPDYEHPAAYGVALFVNFVQQLRAISPGQEWIEQRVALTDQIWGRLDYGHWHAADAVVTIADKKNGFVDVPVEENDQLRIYGASLISQHKLPAKWLRYVIVQPNSIVPGPRVKQWVEPVESVMRFAERASAIPAGPKQFVAGEHCRYCPLFGRCPATTDLLKQLATMLQHTAEDVLPDQIATMWALKRPVEDWFKSLEKLATKRALAGAIAPGTKLVTANTHRAWKDVVAARAAVVERFGIDALDPPTPTQAEKMGLDISELAEKPEGAPVLAFASDKRPEFRRKSAQEMFAGVIGATPPK
jgi:hypothetical protein